MVQAIGGRETISGIATQAVTEGGLANWRWGLKLTSLYCSSIQADSTARQTRATAARGLGQRTDSSQCAGLLCHGGTAA